MSKSTALGAAMEVKKEESHTHILFKDSRHEEFFYRALFTCRSQDVYHQALCYCLGILSDTREMAAQIYDFKTGYINPDCIHEGWITSGSRRILLLAFNLYTDTTSTVSDEDNVDEQLRECRDYSVSHIFCCGDAKYFWQAIKLRYPDYASIEGGLYA